MTEELSYQLYGNVWKRKLPDGTIEILDPTEIVIIPDPEPIVGDDPSD